MDSQLVTNGLSCYVRRRRRFAFAREWEEGVDERWARVVAVNQEATG